MTSSLACVGISSLDVDGVRSACAADVMVAMCISIHRRYIGGAASGGRRYTQDPSQWPSPLTPMTFEKRVK